MMMLIFTVRCVYGFVPSSKPSIDSFVYYGDIAPLQYFDPLQVTSTMNEKDIKYLREAELHHGRIAMASFLGMVVSDIVGKGPAINNLFQAEPIEQFPFWFGVFCYEFSRMGHWRRHRRTKMQNPWP